MFFLLLLLGLSGPKSLDGKRRAKLGEEQWAALVPATRSLKGLKTWTLVAALALYAVLFLVHEGAIGLAPLP